MKAFTLTASILISAFAAKAQKFYVEKTKEGAESVITKKLLALDQEVVFREDSADYVFKWFVQRKSAGIAKGSLGIVEAKSGKLVVMSSESTGRANVAHWYKDPVLQIAERVSEKELPGMLKKATSQK